MPLGSSKMSSAGDTVAWTLCEIAAHRPDGGTTLCCAAGSSAVAAAEEDTPLSPVSLSSAGVLSLTFNRNGADGISEPDEIGALRPCTFLLGEDTEAAADEGLCA